MHPFIRISNDRAERVDTSSMELVILKLAGSEKSTATSQNTGHQFELMTINEDGGNTYQAFVLKN